MPWVTPEWPCTWPYCQVFIREESFQRICYKPVFILRIFTKRQNSDLPNSHLTFLSLTWITGWVLRTYLWTSLESYFFDIFSSCFAYFTMILAVRWMRRRSTLEALTGLVLQRLSLVCKASLLAEEWLVSYEEADMHSVPISMKFLVEATVSECEWNKLLPVSWQRWYPRVRASLCHGFKLVHMTKLEIDKLALWHGHGTLLVTSKQGQGSNIAANNWVRTKLQISWQKKSCCQLRAFNATKTR